MANAVRTMLVSFGAISPIIGTALRHGEENLVWAQTGLAGIDRHEAAIGRAKVGLSGTDLPKLVVCARINRVIAIFRALGELPFREIRYQFGHV